MDAPLELPAAFRWGAITAARQIRDQGRGDLDAMPRSTGARSAATYTEMPGG